ncbi:MAG: type I-MYXAN CRISPR-associated protein Cas6/Cmx6 [Candidatus Thiodiazotropha taylori]|nr:type I-MYXAN CRISPR-associated protein Cas6/Cmx6 [Candidatus Thiodiazotropha taylori]
MFWQEEQDEERFVVPDNVLDLLFKINCPTLPIDHAWALSQAIQQALPWFADEPNAGLHLIYGADSGNGWERPSGGDQLLYLSRRTPLALRLPNSRIEDAQVLSGQTLDIDGHTLQIGKSHTRLLGMTTTLYCRHLLAPENQSEDEFLQQSVAQLKALNLSFKKVLCGKGEQFETPEGPLITQSLMVAGLPLDDAVTLQEEGLGPLRTRGFGLFNPHKTV